REVDTAVFRVGARNVQFIPGETGVILECPNHFHVVFGLVAKNVGEHGGLESRQRGKLFFHERAHAYVLQADRVDHAKLGLIDARWRITFDRFARESLHYETTERVEIYQFLEFHAIGECARSGQYRVAKPDAAQRGFEQTHGA